MADVQADGSRWGFCCPEGHTCVPTRAHEAAPEFSLQAALDARQLATVRAALDLYQVFVATLVGPRDLSDDTVNRIRAMASALVGAVTKRWPN